MTEGCRGLTEDEIQAACKEPELPTKVLDFSYSVMLFQELNLSLGFHVSTNYV